MITDWENEVYLVQNYLLLMKDLNARVVRWSNGTRTTGPIVERGAGYAVQKIAKDETYCLHPDPSGDLPVSRRFIVIEYDDAGKRTSVSHSFQRQRDKMKFRTEIRKSWETLSVKGKELYGPRSRFYVPKREGKYEGVVVAETRLQIAQMVGAKSFVIHTKNTNTFITGYKYRIQYGEHARRQVFCVGKAKTLSNSLERSQPRQAEPRVL